jgi:hypothetical protein
MPGITTGEDRTAHSSSSHPGDHPDADLPQDQIKRRPVLGGLLNEYERAV